MQRIENKTFDEIRLGDTASLVRTLTHKDIEVFAIMSGDVNPAHVDEAFAKSDMFHKVVAHGMWGASLISTVLGTELPGPGTIYVDQSLHFRPARGARRYNHRDRSKSRRRSRKPIASSSNAGRRTSTARTS